MNITIEQIEELRRITHVNFEEAERTLRKTKGDLPRAISIIEHRRNSRMTKFVNEIVSIFKHLLDYRLVIRRHDMILLNLSIVTIILIGIFIPYISLTHVIILTLIGLLTECDFRIVDSKAKPQQKHNSTSAAKLRAVERDNEIVLEVNEPQSQPVGKASSQKVAPNSTSAGIVADQLIPAKPIIASQQIREDAEGYNEIVIK